MRNLNFSNAFQNEVRSKWFNHFLKRNKLTVTKEKIVVRLSNLPQGNEHKQQRSPQVAQLSTNKSSSGLNHSSQNKRQIVKTGEQNGVNS
jgi:hypothetical protein